MDVERVALVLPGPRPPAGMQSDLIYEDYHDAFGSHVAPDAGNPPG